MKSVQRMIHFGKSFGLLAVFSFGLLFQPTLKADVVLLQSGAVVTGKVLQQDGNGVLMQTEFGTYRYPLAWIKDVKKEAATARHISNNGQTIPDWAQIITSLADSGFAPEIKQVPAPVISSGNFKNVPYISFRCAYGGYEINIYGDLSQPAAVQIGAMGYLQNNAAAKSNCVNFVCSVLASTDARKMVRGLNWSQKDVETKNGLTFETLLPGEMGSYGGWWVSVYNSTALANAQASDAELLALAQPRVAAAQPVMSAMSPATVTNNMIIIDNNPPSAAATTQSGQITSSGTYTPAYGWTAAEMADAHLATAAAVANNSDMVYPRTYDRTAGTYGVHRR
jgi:hypothetical protein